MKRPLTVIIIACLLMVTGALGIVFHLSDFKAQPFQYENVWISLVRLTAIVCGIFMLRGNNWARWLAIVWMAFHVIVGSLHSVREGVVHALFLLLFAYFLFRPEARAYFGRGRSGDQESTAS